MMLYILQKIAEDKFVGDIQNDEKTDFGELGNEHNPNPIVQHFDHPDQEPGKSTWGIHGELSWLKESS